MLGAITHIRFPEGLDSERELNSTLSFHSAARRQSRLKASRAHAGAEPNEDCGMIRRSLLVAFGFLGLLLVGTAAGTQPASAGYACGPWNNWCKPSCGPWNGWCTFWSRPNYGWGHNHHNKRKSYGHWNGDHNWNKNKWARKGGGDWKHKGNRNRHWD
jgi:hypothetical protein